MINTAVIGLGNMGKHHARVYNQLEESHLVAVADINPSIGRQMAERFGCRFYEDYRQMLSEETIEAVSVAVPTTLHEAVSIHCLEKGLHVLVEKPIADTIESAENITRCAEAKRLVLQVGHIEHFNPAVVKLKEILKQDALGKLLSILVRRVGIAPPQIKDANVIVDLAIHDIELCNFLTEQMPEHVYCRAGAGILADREDYADIFLEYNGVNAMIQANWITPVKIRQMHLTGTRGYAELDFIEQQLFLAETVLEQEFDDFGTFVTKFSQSNKTEIPVTKTEPLKLEIAHFLNCVTQKQKPDIDGRRATEALSIALKAWQESLAKSSIGRYADPTCTQ